MSGAQKAMVVLGLLALTAFVHLQFCECLELRSVVASIRFSLGRFTTEGEVDRAVEMMVNAVAAERAARAPGRSAERTE